MADLIDRHPTQNNTLNTLESLDCVSRQAAIDAVKCGALSAAMVYGRTDEGSTALYETIRAIKALPSAQPDPDIIHLQKEQAYMQGYEDGQAALREELWERERERREE